MLPDQSRVTLYVVRSLRIEPSTVVKVLGKYPPVIVALDGITVLGSIALDPGTAGGATNAGAMAPSVGSGPGGGGAERRAPRARLPSCGPPGSPGAR